MEKESGVELWNKVLTAALSVPGVKVNRSNFLSKELKNYCDDEKLKLAIDSMPLDVVSMDIIDKIAAACIWHHTFSATIASAATGIPGGLGALLGLVPTDMAQYYYHTFVLSQKLAYLYGYPELYDEEGNITEESQNALTLFIGEMMGVNVAKEGIIELSKAISAQVVKRLPRVALTKGTIYPLVKQVTKMIGIKLSKKIFANTLGKTIPIIGAIIAGGLTWATFMKAAKRLRNTFRENSKLFALKAQNVNKEYTPYEDVDSSDNIGMQLLIALINMAKIDFNVAPEEEEYIAKQIEESDLDDNDKMELINKLHSKEISDVDLSAFKTDAQYSTALIKKLVEVAKADNVVKPVERIYLFKIGEDLGFKRDDIMDMLK